MRWFGAVLVWTVVVVAILLLVPSPLNTPSCGRAIEIDAACVEAMRAENDRVWLTHTLPWVLVIIGGYALIYALALQSRRTGI